jgi:hypothetical protein
LVFASAHKVLSRYHMPRRDLEPPRARMLSVPTRGIMIGIEVSGGLVNEADAISLSQQENFFIIL